ncbi:MAG: hypothetical protein ACI9W2_003520 [Gammaproteobacteria bacterium]|jgi:hypothetical protein
MTLLSLGYERTQLVVDNGKFGARIAPPNSGAHCALSVDGSRCSEGQCPFKRLRLGGLCSLRLSDRTRPSEARCTPVSWDSRGAYARRAGKHARADAPPNSQRR